MLVITIERGIELYCFNDYLTSAEYIKKKITVAPEIAIILGTGLGMYVSNLDGRQDIYYNEIPLFPNSNKNNDSYLSFGQIGNKDVLIQNGNFYYYEGHSFETSVYPIRVYKLLGIKTIIISCAVGGINKSFKCGDLVVINDHIKFFGDSPLRGVNIPEFGDRFVDMSQAYSQRLIQAAELINPKIKKGSYAFMPGPNFETPLEINVLRTWGADVVGMAVIPDVITAVHAGIEVMVISHISSMAAGVTNKSPVSHTKSKPANTKTFQSFINFINEIIQLI